MAMDTAVFERIGIHVRPDELEQLVRTAIEQMVPARRSMNLRHELPPDEAEALVRAGMQLESVDRGAADPLVRSAAAYAALVASSLTVVQAAERLGVDSSRIRHRLADRTLYGIRLPTGWRIPLFQFVDSQLVPGIAEVLPHLTPGLHPLSVLNWFTQPHPDLVVGEQETPVSPIEWLVMGMNPRVVVELAQHVGQYA